MDETYLGSDSLEDIYEYIAEQKRHYVDYSMVHTMTLKIMQEHIQDVESENEALIKEIDRLRVENASK